MSNGLNYLKGVISTITGVVIGFQLAMIVLWASRPLNKPHNLGNYASNQGGNVCRIHADYPKMLVYIT